MLSRIAMVKLVKSFDGNPVSTVAMSMISGLFEACYASSVALVDIMATERRLVAVSGPPESHTVTCKY